MIWKKDSQLKLKKLELRVTDSNPFNVKTKDYWDNVSKKYDINGQDEKEEKRICYYR